MRRRIVSALALAGALLFLATGVRAQTQTNVTATVTDPLGIPYANGTYSIQLIPSGNNPSVNGAAIAGAFNGSTDANGRFNVSLWPNSAISPGGTQWQVTVCVSPGVQPPLGTGSQCSTPPLVVTISGASQDLSSALDAVAPRLTSITIGGITSVVGSSPIVVTTVAGVATVSCPTCGTGTIGGTIAATQVAFGSALNTIEGDSSLTYTLSAKIFSLDPSVTNLNAGYDLFGLNAISEPNAANLAVGANALSAVGASSGTNNTGVGITAGASISSGSDNTAVGANAMSGGTTFTGNTGIGNGVLQSSNGNFNSGLGFGALLGVTSGVNNTGMGPLAGDSIVTGSDNTLYGFHAGHGSPGTSGSTNVIIGEETNTTAAISTGNNNLLFGNSLAAFTAGTAGLSHTGSFQLDIGDVILGTVLNTPNSSVITFPGTVHSGTDNTSAGIFRSANSAAAAHTDWGSQATTSNEVDGPTTVATNGNLVSWTVSGAKGRLTDSGVSAASVSTPVQIDNVAQSAPIGATTLVACPASPAGGTNYLLSSNAKVTTAASVSSTLGPLSITFTTPDGTTFTNMGVPYRIAPVGTAINVIGDSLNTTTTFDSGLPLLVNCQAGSTITYAMGYTSAGGTAMVYDLHIRARPQ